jgi:RNA polymerase sigma-70 factor, ECF subfamily
MSVNSVRDPDIGLVERIVARDATAVAELYDRNSRMLFGVIMRILRNQSDAEEILQEVFVRVWTRADSYDERLGCPAAWLIRIARNQAIDRLRAKRTRGELDAIQPASADDLSSTTVLTPEHVVADSRRRDTILQALNSLTAEQRALITAAFFEGYTHAELAARFNLPLGTVKTRIRSGMLAMRGRLEHAV